MVSQIESPTSRRSRKAKTRAAVLDAAIRVYSRAGILAASSSEIAAEAGVAHGTVFLHFASRDKLLAASIEEFGERLVLRLHELVRREGSMVKLLAAHLGGLAEYEPFYRRLVVEGPLLPRAARDTLVLIQSAVAFHLGPAFERGRMEGAIKPMPFHLFLNTWLGLLHYYLANAELFAPGGSPLLSKGQELLGHFASLVAAAPAARASGSKET